MVVWYTVSRQMQFEKVKLAPVVDGVSQSSCENGMSNFYSRFCNKSYKNDMIDESM